MYIQEDFRQAGFDLAKDVIAWIDGADPANLQYLAKPGTMKTELELTYLVLGAALHRAPSGAHLSREWNKKYFRLSGKMVGLFFTKNHFHSLEQSGLIAAESA